MRHQPDKGGNACILAEIRPILGPRGVPGISLRPHPPIGPDAQRSTSCGANHAARMGGWWRCPLRQQPNKQENLSAVAAHTPIWGPLAFRGFRIALHSPCGHPLAQQLRPNVLPGRNRRGDRLRRRPCTGSRIKGNMGVYRWRSALFCVPWRSVASRGFRFALISPHGLPLAQTPSARVLRQLL